MTLLSRLRRLEKSQGTDRVHEPGSVSGAVWVVEFGRLCDQYRQNGLGEVFDAADRDLQKLLADDRKPPGQHARDTLNWLIETEHKLHWNPLSDGDIIQAARQIERRS
jgi:hypothetical protein